jgi:hypothetical protein
MDPMLQQQFLEVKEIEKCVYIALLCVQENPESRPNMETVRNMFVSQMIFPNLPSNWSHSSLIYDQFREGSTTTDTSTNRSKAGTTSTQSVHSQAGSSMIRGTKSGDYGIY